MIQGIVRVSGGIALCAVAAAMAPLPARAQGSTPFVGQLMYEPFNFAPKGWAFCDGQVLAISTNTALFSLLGTFYGGDGKANFALPDMRGRVPLMQGQGAGLSNYALGQSGGTETVTLLTSNLPAHSHSMSLNSGTVSASSAVANSAVPTGHALANTGHNPAYASTAPDVNLASVTLTGSTGLTGGSTPFAVRTPYLVVSCAIALQGVFPPRN
jgi:microcystin-dependent protein